MSCDRCPIPDRCPAWPIFCAWAAEDPADPVKLAHIRHRSTIDPAEYPPLAMQAGSLARSLWDWAVSGFAMATEAEQSRRLTICHDCPQWDDGRCRICGCYVKVKITMKTEHCPIAKW